MQQKRNWFSEFLGRCVTPLRRIKIQSRLLLTFLAVSLVPVVFIGLYAYRVEVLKEITALPQSSLEIAESLEQLRWLENGYTIKAGITDVETIGIDTPQDLERAEEFLKSHGL